MMSTKRKSTSESIGQDVFDSGVSSSNLSFEVNVFGVYLITFDISFRGVSLVDVYRFNMFSMAR